MKTTLLTLLLMPIAVSFADNTHNGGEKHKPLADAKHRLADNIRVKDSLLHVIKINDALLRYRGIIVDN